MREFLTGNEAVVCGALRAGCNFFAGYPITPASSILQGFIKSFSDGGGTAIETEDEMAAIGQCIGAAMAGAKALTATSGPGLSLYSENIGLAQMGEVPLVIVDCQRMGPATGGATATGEGDVVFARHVTSGGYPLPVLAVTDAASAYRLTYRAFNLAEAFRTPVIVLSSKDIGLTRQTVDFESIALEPVRHRTLAPADRPFLPFDFAALDDTPAFAPIGDSRQTRFTGSIHDERGMLTIKRDVIHRKLTHLRDKIEWHVDDFEDVAVDAQAEADTLIISYGLADGAARQAVRQLRSKGQCVSHLTLYSLWPMPLGAVARAMSTEIRRIIVPEHNIGLYVEELRRVIHGAEIESLSRYDGGMISPQMIVQSVKGSHADVPLLKGAWS